MFFKRTSSKAGIHIELVTMLQLILRKNPGILTQRLNCQYLKVVYSVTDFEICLHYLCLYEQLVPDPESNRCKVVIGSCELEKPYKVYVVAVPEGGYSYLPFHMTFIKYHVDGDWFSTAFAILFLPTMITKLSI